MNKRTQQGNETKKKIVDCAKKLFVEKGYNNVTVDEIIKKSDSSKGGFYTHFKKKEDLIFNMIPMVDNAYLAFSKINKKYENSIEKISSLMNYAFQLMEKGIGLEYMSVIYSAQIKDLTTHRFLTAPEREYYYQLKTLIEEAQRNKEITADLSSEEIVSILTTCIRGVIYDWCLKKGSFQLVPYGMKLINMMLNQIKI